MVSPSKLSAQDSWTTFSLVQQPSATGHTRRKNSQQHPGAVFVQQSLNKTSMNQSTGEERSLRSNTTGDEGDYFFSALSQGERQTFTGSGKALLHQKHWLPFSYSTPYVKVWYKDELKSSMPISWKENPPETIATSGVYWPTRPSALLSTLARSAIAAAVVAAVLDDVTRGWGGGESLLFRRRAGRGHKRPFASTVEPQPRHRPLHSHDAADARKPPRKQEWGKQDVFTVNCVADATAACTKIRTEPNSTLEWEPSGTTKRVSQQPFSHETCR